MKKKINIILVIAVLALWGTAGYRYVNNYFFVQDDIIPDNPGTTQLSNIIAQRDTFSMKPLERDPFLDKVSARGRIAPESGPKPSPLPKRKTTAQPVHNAEWPRVEYFGYIKSGSNGELALIKIDGQLFKLHKGETKKEISVQKIFRDSIYLIYNKEKKVYKH